MKLKKIASLALAGVMAVSMLAGCSGKGNAGNDNNGGSTSTATSIVEAVNKGQSAKNDVKVTFTADPALDSAAKRAGDVYGNALTETNLKTMVEELTGIKSVAADAQTGTFRDNSGLLNKTTNYKYVINTQKLDLDGDTYTYVGYKTYTGFLSEKAVLNAIAKEADTLIAALPAHSTLTTDGSVTSGVVADGQELKAGEKYYGFSYDGNISMVSVQKTDGTTSYLVVYVLNQHVAEKTL